MSAAEYREEAAKAFARWIETGNGDHLRASWAADETADRLEQEAQQPAVEEAAERA